MEGTSPKASRELLPTAEAGRAQKSIRERTCPSPDPARQNSGAPVPQPAVDWNLFLEQTVLYATYQIGRLRWRGDPGGVLPFGYDANSIAAEAILELLSTDPSLTSAASHPFANGSPTTPPPAFRAEEGVGEGLRGNRKSKIKNRKFSLPFRREEIPPNNSPFEPTNRRRKSSADFQSALRSS